MTRPRPVPAGPSSPSSPSSPSGRFARRRCTPLAVAAALALPLAGVPALAGPAAASAVGEEDPEGEAVEGVREVVVALQRGADAAAVAADAGLVLVRQLAGSRGVHLMALPGGDEGADITAVAASVAADPRVRFAEPNFRTGMPEGDPNWAWGNGGPQVVGTDPEAWTSQPALQQVQATQAQATTRGEGTVVAVLDTGVDAGHPALAGRLVRGADVLDGDSDPAESPDGLDDDGDGRVDEAHGHGTHVAGTVLAVAPDARVMPVRVLTADGNGYVFTVAEGMRAAAAAGADVVNLSLGSAVESRLLREVLASLPGDVQVVAAAGNDASTARQYPAASEGTLGVASVDGADVRSAFTNYGWVDVAAPGEGVVSTFPGGRYAAWGGTSMATPLVSGQVALLVAAGSTDPAAAVLATADPAGPDVGAGRVDVAASLAQDVAAGGGEGDGDEGDGGEGDEEDE